MKNKWFLLLMIRSGILAILISGVFTPGIFRADEVFINKMCQQQQDLPQIERFSVFYQAEFSAQNQIYWFYAGRYQDGGVIFCVSEPDFNQAGELNAQELQFQFIEDIQQDSTNPSDFIITVAEGNGRNVPLVNYKLELSNPNQPILTRLGQI